MSQLLLRTSQCIFLGGHEDSRDSPTSFTVLLASNLLAQFSRQIVIQILGLESPKVICLPLVVAQIDRFVDLHQSDLISIPD
jgi:hypothetical protein